MTNTLLRSEEFCCGNPECGDEQQLDAVPREKPDAVFQSTCAKIWLGMVIYKEENKPIPKKGEPLCCELEMPGSRITATLEKASGPGEYWWELTEKLRTEIGTRKYNTLRLTFLGIGKLTCHLKEFTNVKTDRPYNIMVIPGMMNFSELPTFFRYTDHSTSRESSKTTRNRSLPHSADFSLRHTQESRRVVYRPFAERVNEIRKRWRYEWRKTARKEKSEGLRAQYLPSLDLSVNRPTTKFDRESNALEVTFMIIGKLSSEKTSANLEIKVGESDALPGAVTAKLLPSMFLP